MPILSEENILGSFLPTVYISKVILNQNRVDLELMLIDTTNKDLNEGVFSLINDEILKGCVRIKIVESTDSSKTQNLFLGISQEYKPLGDEGYTLNYITSGNNKEIDINNSLDNLKFESDEEGNKKYYYSTFFDTNTIGLNHLSYIVFCEIDQDALRDKFGLSVNELQLNIPKKISGEIVIDERKVVSNSYVYYVKNDNDIQTLWLGEVTYLNNEYQTLEQPPRILTQLQVPNNKIQDFRLRDIIQENTVLQQLSNSSNNLIELQTTINRNLNNPLSQPRIFEEPIKYLNSDGTISISIFVNIQEFIRQNCLFTNTSLLTEQILEETQNSIINNLSLHRRQINKIISNDGRVIIEPLKEQLSNVVSENSLIKKQNIGPYLHLLLQDQTIKDIRNGIYQYGIEIKFQDPTFNIVLSSFRRALNANKQLLQYFNICQLFIDRKTSNFMLELNDYLNKESINIEEIINEYLDIYETFYELPVELTISDLRRNLLSNINQINGSLDGISLFMKMFEDLISDIGKLLSITKSSNEITDFDTSSISTKSNVQILKYFPNLIHNLDETTKLELKYFNINSGQVDGPQFNNTIDKITRPQSGQLLYVSPKSILIYKQEYDFDSIKNATTSSANWVIPAISDGTERTNYENVVRILQDNKYRLIKNKILNILKERDFQSNLAVLKISSDSQARINNEAGTTALDLPREVAILQQNNIFNDYSVTLYSSTNEDQQIQPYLKNDRRVILGIENDETSLEKIIQPRIQINTSTVQNNPVLSTIRNINLNNEEESFKYLMLGKIQYLRNNSNNHLEWSDVTKSTLNGTEFVCRLLPYDYGQIGIQNINNFFYNDCFILNYSTELQLQSLAPPAPAPSAQPAGTLTRPPDNTLLEPTTETQSSPTTETSTRSPRSPVINSITPNILSVTEAGPIVTITGRNFDLAGKVRFAAWSSRPRFTRDTVGEPDEQISGLFTVSTSDITARNKQSISFRWTDKLSPFRINSQYVEFRYINPDEQFSSVFVRLQSNTTLQQAGQRLSESANRGFQKTTSTTKTEKQIASSNPLTKMMR